MALGRLPGNLLSAVGGVVVGGLIVLGADGVTRTPEPLEEPAERTPRSEDVRPPPITPSEDVLLLWAVNGVPRGVARTVARVPQVDHISRVSAGLDWIEWSRSPDGSPVDDSTRAGAIPVEVAAIEPRSYARFAPPGDRATILSLKEGEAILSRTARRLRGAGEGLTIGLRSGDVRVSGTVSDEATNGYEMLVAAPAPRSWRRADPFLLIQSGSPRFRQLQRTVRRSIGAGIPFRLRARGETPFLRHGDGVLPQMLLKQAFGEFSAGARPNGFLNVESSWARKNIVTDEVPLLGEVTCHRALFPQLRGALAELERSGAGFLLDPSDYGGCYSPRFINARPDAGISHHSWGVAVDLNVSENAYGTKPNIDRRIVEIMESWGFTWGGRWLVPDGMHFEWTRFP